MDPLELSLCALSHLVGILSIYETLFFGYPKNIPGPPQIINYPDRGPELGGPILKKFTLGSAGPTRRLGLWRNSGPEMAPEAPRMATSRSKMT